MYPKGKLFFSRIPPGIQQRESYSSWQQLTRGPCSPYMDRNRNSTSRSLTQFDSTISLNDKKLKVSQNIRQFYRTFKKKICISVISLTLHCLLLKEQCPEFIRMLDEAQVVLELPSSIVVS